MPSQMVNQRTVIALGSWSAGNGGGSALFDHGKVCVQMAVVYLDYSFSLVLPARFRILVIGQWKWEDLVFSVAGEGSRAQEPISRS